VEGLSKGKYVEDHVRRFAVSKNWKVPVGTKEQEIEKIRAARVKADRNTADVNAMTGAL
jgi:hypothetical protein